MFKLAKSSFYDMFSTHFANSKSYVLSGSSSYGLVFPHLPSQFTVDLKRYHCKLRVKLLIEPQTPRWS